MAKFFDAISPDLATFILAQPMFFVATAPRQGQINLSPKGLDSLRLLDATTIAYLDRTGSGNETSAHLLDDGRMTMMFCAFEGPGRILRLYGRAKVIRRGEDGYSDLLARHFEGAKPPGARQFVVMHVERGQTSCGDGVPLMTFVGHRTKLDVWAASKGEADLEAYRQENNTVSIDGLPTGWPGGSVNV